MENNYINHSNYLKSIKERQKSIQIYDFKILKIQKKKIHWKKYIKVLSILYIRIQSINFFQTIIYVSTTHI